jgi:hypothetical protein
MNSHSGPEARVSLRANVARYSCNDWARKAARHELRVRFIGNVADSDRRCHACIWQDMQGYLKQPDKVARRREWPGKADRDRLVRET